MLHPPVHIDDSRCLFEDVPDLLCQVQALVQIRAIDLRHHGGQHWRSGRDFGDLDVGTGPFHDGSQQIAHLLGQGMTGPVAVMLGQQVDLQIRHQRARAQKVVSDETVEVEGCRVADVHLYVGDFGQGSNDFGQRPGDPCRLLEGGSFGHVDDDLHLALVVVRQHLDLDEAQGDQTHRGQ